MAIRVARSAGLVTITLDRPAKKNALDSQTWIELDRALADVAADPDDRALILTGAGGKAAEPMTPHHGVQRRHHKFGGL